MGVAGAEGPRKGFAIASLVLGVLSLPTVGLLLVGALAGIVLGVVALVKARDEPAEYGGKGLAITGIALSVLSVVVMPCFIGIIAAIAIPSLLRARVSANEAAAIGDVRTFSAAESAYQSANGGYYDSPQCLASPSTCLPRYSGPAMLQAPLIEESRGYRRTFVAGPPPDEVLPATVSRSSLTAFAYVAVPITQNRTGVRSFCVDASGQIRSRMDGAAPERSEARCPDEWTVLR